MPISPFTLQVECPCVSVQTDIQQTSTMPPREDDPPAVYLTTAAECGGRHDDDFKAKCSSINDDTGHHIDKKCVDDPGRAATAAEEDAGDTPQGDPECTMKPWEAPPPPEWLEHHRTELWPTYDLSSYRWPDLIAELMHTPVGVGVEGVGFRV